MTLLHAEETAVKVESFKVEVLMSQWAQREVGLLSDGLFVSLSSQVRFPEHRLRAGDGVQQRSCRRSGAAGEVAG